MKSCISGIVAPALGAALVIVGWVTAARGADGQEAVTVSEPASVLLFGVGLVVVGLWLRHRRRNR